MICVFAASYNLGPFKRNLKKQRELIYTLFNKKSKRICSVVSVRRVNSSLLYE